MKKAVCVIIILFMYAGISAANQRPKQGDYELVRIENRSQFYVETSCLAHPVCLRPGETAVVRRGPSYGLGEFYFIASAYAINNEGLKEFVSRQKFNFYLDGSAQPRYNGQDYEYFGAVVIMSYFPVESYDYHARSYSGPDRRRISLGPLSLIVNVDFWGTYPRRNYYPHTYITQEVLVWRGGGNYHPRRGNNRRGADYYNNRGYYYQRPPRQWRN
jgi:hypothetical protein